MEKYGLNQLRAMFQEFYEEKGHFARKSFPLIPEKDKSLLIINSGMAPLKPYFAGLETPPSKRMTTCQKCVRTGDIDNVGHTARHGTFFEMLGSFSFGDYFKRESLLWGWEFITERLKMPADRLWASVYEDDDEAYAIWAEEVGLPAERIVKLGKEDNFWEIGVGPCGPCSEVYFDRGEAFGCGKADCKPGCECDRYVEFWNHVFTQFNRDENGGYAPLEQKNIDTGMGLERLACIMQDTDSIFNIDTISYVLEGVCQAAGVAYEGGAGRHDVSIRIITDHIRSVVFMTGDGIIPGNEGRGYVLRRLLRRAARHGRLIGARGAFLSALADRVIDISKGHYQELDEKREYIKKIISVEEEKFNATIVQGTEILEGYIGELKKGGGSALSGEKAFKLYDTFGFPLELTQEILAENGFSADEDGFALAMGRQKEAARAARKGSDGEGWADEGLDGALPPTEFTGYGSLTGVGAVLRLLKDNKEVGVLEAGDKGVAVLDRTPFYAESGGQVGDRGAILVQGEAPASAEVLDVTKSRDIFLHHVEVKSGALRAGAEARAEVDAARRNRVARNHTATHILQRALRQVLGAHVEQAGSYVSPDGLRFDFTHFEAMKKEDLEAVEAIVNEVILSFPAVETQVTSMADAVEQGAMALFGEKYGDKVRLVKVGDFSAELCGGTHLANAGQAGAFKILSESGVAAGVRRIEAITGDALLRPLAQAEALIRSAAEALKTSPDNLLGRVAAVLDESKAARKELEAYRKGEMDSAAGDMLGSAKEINGVKLVARAMKGQSADDLRALSDKIRAAAKSVITVLATENDGKATFIVSVSDDLLGRGFHAGNMIKQIAAAAGGGGGGKADMAQAGAKDPSKIAEALAVAERLLGSLS
ncbi:MAG: alanine--tRNA ligase [Clostridiales Family XIII bacterium]|jgi:alanyl-tRNA synthetase|nr:alanine--tRNA ligase [Clostridiales Family XIII bacterium]